MFDYKHYVSVLRWKAAEKEALEKLSDKEKKYLTPLIELIMPQPVAFRTGEGEVKIIKTHEELLNESIEKLKSKIPGIPEEILKFWGTAPIFIDLSLIDFSLRVNGLEDILSTGIDMGLYLIPVVTLASDNDLKKVATLHAQKSKQGICLRLFRSDFKPSLGDDVKSFLTNQGLLANQVDLIIDFQITDSKCLEIKDFIKQIPSISDWRTFTVISGTFPKDLMEFTVDMHFKERSDWNCWLEQINSGDLLRKPAFGDYTIQHPIYLEPSPGSNPSASIRYTLPDKWMIMRGQGLRGENSAGHAQYPAQAHLLLEQKEFFGAGFSFGDAYIARIGSDITTKETGNPRTWLRAGINHHLACVISQVSNLP
ncbi:beta family protein [Candidatus Daviesbacteria bacterium]|nr:beta family protein [Candidatus Daviesbacteria bacterium]